VVVNASHGFGRKVKKVPKRILPSWFPKMGGDPKDKVKWKK